MNPNQQFDPAQNEALSLRATEAANTFIREDVLASHAYLVPDARGLIKLDAMENPFGFPERLRDDLNTDLAKIALNRYPQPAYAELKDRLRATYKIPAVAQIMVGNGSDELIDIVVKALARDGASILAPEPGFVMYRGSAMQARVRYIPVALQANDFGLDLPAMLAAIREHQPALIFIAFPNNPTGNCFATADIEAILAAAPGLVVLDEAYQPFAQDSWMDRLPEFPNMVVMRTVSKWGLAGIRLGYMAGSPAWMSQFEKIRPPYNVNVLTEAVALFCLKHESDFNEQTTILRQERESLFAALKRLPNVQPFESRANFVLTRFTDSAAVLQGLRDDRILVKDVGRMHPLLKNCLRLTIGTPQENQLMLHSLTRICTQLAQAH